jgi:XTP/dITP diphosphohydrolase
VNKANPTTNRFQLLVGTKNSGKFTEVSALLHGLGIDLVSLTTFPGVGTADETAHSYAENAIQKARSYAQQTGLCALAEDSGLEVDALGGRPAVFSARYGGGELNDWQRIERLLRELSTTADSQRTARFRSTVVVVNPLGEVLHVAEGECEGNIAREARGENGFGYDPIFIPRGHTRTFAELAAKEKDQLSHRAKALKLTKIFLLEYF